jgi:hypothetical protein
MLKQIVNTKPRRTLHLRFNHKHCSDASLKSQRAAVDSICEAVDEEVLRRLMKSAPSIPVIDKKLLIKSTKDKLVNLKAALKAHIRLKNYWQSAECRSIIETYEFLLVQINKGLYDVIPKK